MHHAHDDNCNCGCVVCYGLVFGMFYSIFGPSSAPKIQGAFQPIEYGVHTFNYSECVRPRLLLEQDADVVFEDMGSATNVRRLRGGGHGGHGGHGVGHGHTSGHSRAEVFAARTLHMRSTRNVVIRTATVYTLLISGRTMDFDRRVYILDHAVLCAEENGVNQLVLNVSSVQARHRAYVLFALIPVYNATIDVND